MTQEFKLRDPGEGVHEVEILDVLVSEGDEVSEGDNVLVVESDKAAIEIPSPFDGKIASIEVSEGDMVEVGSMLMRVDSASGSETGTESGTKSGSDTGDDGADGVETGGRSGSGEAEEQEAAGEGDQDADKKADEAREGGSDRAGPRREAREERPVLATPAVRGIARELGVDLRDVPASGEDGRVTEEDVRSHAGAGAAEKGRGQERRRADRAALPDFARWGEIERQPLRSVRRNIMRNMSRSWREIPHVTHCEDADVTELESFRRKNADAIARDGGKLTPLVLLMKATAAALREFPRLNASVDADAEEIILKDYCNLGIATDTDRGLLVPVLRDVDRKSVSDIAVEAVDLAERARAGELERDEMQGGTFTITNAGAIGARYFAPIINWPETAILGLGTIRAEPVIRGDVNDFDVGARLVLPLSLSFDHRVVDGAEAARFVNHIKDAIADPDSFAVST